MIILFSTSNSVNEEVENSKAMKNSSYILYKFQTSISFAPQL